MCGDYRQPFVQAALQGGALQAATSTDRRRLKRVCLNAYVGLHACVYVQDRPAVVCTGPANLL